MAPWGGIFDFNFDGKTSWDEQALGYMIINECMKEDSEDDDSSFSGSGIFSSGADHSWRSLYDYDLETGIDPDDYETEDEYQEALNAAKTAWRDYHFYDPETGIDPDDYETEEEFEEALTEAKNAWKDKYRYVTDIISCRTLRIVDQRLHGQLIVITTILDDGFNRGQCLVITGIHKGCYIICQLIIGHHNGSCIGRSKSWVVAATHKVIPDNTGKGCDHYNKEYEDKAYADQNLIKRMPHSPSR